MPAKRFVAAPARVTRMRVESGRPGAVWLGAMAGVILLGQVAMRALAPGLTDEATAPLPAALGFVAAAMVAGLAWLAAATAVLRIGAPAGLAALFTLGVGLRLAWLDAPVVLDTDWLRYLWDGGLSAHGLSPWGPPPASGLPSGLPPEAVALHPRLPFAGLRSIYPATAQAAFLLAHWIAPWDLLGLRLVMLAAEFAGLAVAVLLLRRLGHGPAAALLWWCCPLPPLVLVMAAHVDALLLPLVGGAVLATLAGRGALAGLLLGLAVGVKVWPLLLAPLLGRWLPAEARLAGAVALGLTAAAVLLPLAMTLAAPDAGLAAYAGGWVANNAPLVWVVALLGPSSQAVLRPLLAAAAVVLALALAWPKPAAPTALPRAVMLLAAGVFYLSPAQFPWYAAWFLPFAAMLACRPLMLAAALVPVWWLFFPLNAAGHGALFHNGVAALHALPVLAWLALRRLGRGA